MEEGLIRCLCIQILAGVEVVNVWPTIILSGISLAAGPDEATIVVVYKRAGQAAPKRRQEQEPGSDAVLLIYSYVQVWNADVGSLLARMGHVSKKWHCLGHWVKRR